MSVYSQYLAKKIDDKRAISDLIYTYLDADQAQDAKVYITRLMKQRPKDTWLEIYLADILLYEGELDKAQEIYLKETKENPGSTYAKLGLSRVLLKKYDYPGAEKIVEEILNNDPKDIEALFCKGEILEAQQEFILAYKLYAEILRIYPNSSNARNLKYRALMKLGSNTLTKDLLMRTKEPIDLELKQVLVGNEAMERIRWNEPKEAMQILKGQNRDFLINNGIATLEAAEYGYPKRVILRNAYDQIMSLKDAENMEEVVRRYEKLKSEKGQLPPWIITAAADAYLYLEKPEKALLLYQEALDKGWDQYGTTKMGMYHTLIDLGRYEEAGKILDQLDNERPVQVVERGVLIDNLRKEEVTYNRCWWYLYQDRLSEANRYILNQLSAAPFDTNIRTALAHTYLWRGWPRLSLQEFEICRQIDPEDINAQVGYCYALNENDQGREARRLAKELLKNNPTNVHIQKLNRDFKVQDMCTWASEMSNSSEHPGVKELSWSTSFEQPLFPWRKIFVNYISRFDHEGTDKFRLNRGYTGVDWRLDRDWWFVGSVSEDTGGNNFGYATKLTYNPNDYLSFITSYDSYGLDIPLEARALGIKQREWDFTARYRQSDDFNGEIIINPLMMSDGNKQYSSTMILDKAITTAAYWKTRISLEANALADSSPDVAYFNPRKMYTLEAIPMVEHVWYKRYGREIIDRLYVGGGAQWEQHFSPQAIGHARYEQEWFLSDTSSFLVGIEYDRRNYSGAESAVWTYDVSCKINF